MNKFITYQDSISFFDSIRYKSNEYFVHGDGLGHVEKKIPTMLAHTICIEELFHKIINLDGGAHQIIVKKESIERFHPNNINNKDFWIKCRKTFPLLSVCGKMSKNMKEANSHTLKYSDGFGLLSFLKSVLLSSDNNLNLLEIGFGYGNLFFEIKDMCNYYGIDYIIPHNLKRYKNFYEINKSGIPDIFLNEELFDVIYCVNVLQHCSQYDRFNYFEEGHSVLKPNGYFIFTEFIMMEGNKNKPYWGFVDQNGRGYTQFFNQLTECDFDYELIYILRKSVV